MFSVLAVSKYEYMLQIHQYTFFENNQCSCSIVDKDKLHLVTVPRNI